MPPAKVRILVVEDEALVLMTVLEQLESFGFRVEGAASATAAVARLAAAPDIAAAIVDMGLPDRNGAVLVGELRALRPGLPVVIASGYGDGLRQRFSGQERIAFLAKPYFEAALLEALASLGIRPAAG